MFNKTRMAFVLMMLAGVILPGCLFHKRDYLKKIPRIEDNRAVVQESKNVTVRTKAYTSQEAKRYFQADLPKCGYKPIQISIENKSDDTYVLRPSYIDLELVPSNRVAKELHNNTLLKSWGLGFIGYLGLIYFHPLWPCLLAAPEYAWFSYKSNKKINQNLQYSVIQDWQGDIVIPPHAHINKFVFTPTRDYRGQFTLGLFNEDAKQYEEFKMNESTYMFVMKPRRA